MDTSDNTEGGPEVDRVNVIWKSYHKPEILDRGYWDQGLLEDIFKQGEFEHHYDMNWVQQGEIKEDQDGAIFIINGRTHIEDAESINKDIAKLRWVLFIITGDEEASFPWRDIKHPIMRVWVMLPRMNEHNDTSFKLVNGYRPQTRELLKKVGQKERDLDWFFAGQVNHDRRVQCVEELRELPNGVLVETDGFGKEVMSYPDYIEHMSRAKIIPCPSGIESPDNFRLYEALEAGCLPVVDAFSTKHQAPGFWAYLFEESPPFPIVDYWDKLPQLLPQLLKEYPQNVNKVSAWWQQHKRKIKKKLEADVKELSR